MLSNAPELILGAIDGLGGRGKEGKLILDLVIS